METSFPHFLFRDSTVAQPKQDESEVEEKSTELQSNVLASKELLIATPAGR